jgi:CBS domain-containing protein
MWCLELRAALICIKIEVPDVSYLSCQAIHPRVRKRQMRARDIMTKDVVTISPETSVRDAAGLMLNQRISGIPVIDSSGKLVGIVTEGDLMRHAELQMPPRTVSSSSSENEAKAYVKAHGLKVKDVMTRDVVTVDEHETQERIAMVLEERGIKRVPVMQAGRMTGIVSRANLLRSLATGRNAAMGPSDSQIKAAIISTARADAAVRLELVDVMVADGVVHLWGNVASPDEGEAMRVVAETTQGVKEVQNHLRVLPPSNIDYKPE